MKSIPKLIRRFVGIMTLSTILLIILNVTFFAIVFVRNTSTFSPWDMADYVAAALQLTDSDYSIFFLPHNRNGKAHRNLKRRYSPCNRGCTA